MPRPTPQKPRPQSSGTATRTTARGARRVRRSSIAGTGGGIRNTGRGGPGGEARPSPGSSPPGTPDLREGAEVTVTTGPVSDAIERLQSQHRELEALLARGPVALARVARALERHAREVEEVFYPALREAAGRPFAPVLTEEVRRHRAIDELMGVLRGLPAGGTRRKRFEELRTQIAEYVRAEEDSVFPEALRRLSRPERLALGERMDLLSQPR